MPTNPADMVEALETALGSGELTVEYEGRRITYRNTEDLRSALSYFRGKITNPDGAAGQPTPASGLRTTFAQFSSE